MTKRSKAATVDLKVRVKEPMRAALERSAKSRGISMNAEMGRRLERSFESEAARGGPDVDAILDAMGAAMKATGESMAFLATGKLHKDGRWLSHPFAFDKAARAAAHVLEGFRPPGEIVRPTPNIVEVVGGDEASAISRAIEFLDRSPELFGDKTLREIGKGQKS
jgi:hypothetical protein